MNSCDVFSMYCRDLRQVSLDRVDKDELNLFQASEVVDWGSLIG